MGDWTEQSISPYSIYIKKGKKLVLFFLVEPQNEASMRPLVSNATKKLRLNVFKAIFLRPQRRPQRPELIILLF